MTNLLFVYGTLLQSGNSFADYLKQNCTDIAAGKLKGKLYDIGEYPGLIIADNDKSYVQGRIYQLHRPKENLDVIDDYEGVGIEQAQPNLYTRELKIIEIKDGLVTAWIYLYNLPIDGLSVISSGNYTEYMAQKKSPGN